MLLILVMNALAAAHGSAGGRACDELLHYCLQPRWQQKRRHHLCQLHRCDGRRKGRYDPESNVLTLEDAHLGSIHANGYDLTLNLVGNNDIIPLSSNATAIIARGLSVQGTGSLHIKTTNAAAITLLDTSLYRQSGGNVTLEGDVIWQDASGIELTGGTLTLGGAGLQRLPAKLDAPDGTKVALFDANGTDAGSWVLPNEAWKTTIAIAAKMVLTAPATIDEASLAALKEGQTYYFDLSGVGIPGVLTRDCRTSLCVMCPLRMPVSWKMFIA